MNRSATRLTPSSADAPLLYAGFGLAGLLFYSLPWVVNTGASLTLTAYDLAEWTSLYPQVRFGEPALWQPFFLRFSPALLTWIVVAGLNSQRGSGVWWAALGGVGLMSVALLPPVEFVFNTGDPNYRQQFLIAVLTLVAGVALLALPISLRIRRVMVVVGIVALIVVSLAGWHSSVELLRGLQLSAEVGAGVLGWVGTLAAFAGVALARRG